MKKTFTIFAAILLTASVFAQSPEKMSYQAVIRDALGNIIIEQEIGMQISILQGTADGTAVYVETQTPTTNANGLVSIEIGAGATSDDFSKINWANGPYFIKSEIDPISGGVNYTITGISQLLSVPYSLFAENAFLLEKRLAKLENTEKAGGYVTDIDGNMYNTVIVGKQVWMAENLKTTKLNDGTEIPLVIDGAEWSNRTTSGYCWYNNNQDTYGNTYGALYNWHTVETEKLCPAGWHVPTKSEWLVLVKAADPAYDPSEHFSSDKSGKKLKAQELWKVSNSYGTNDFGFSALPGGYRMYTGIFYSVEEQGGFWTSTLDGGSGAYYSLMFYNNYSGDATFSYPLQMGHSVRCIKD